MSDNSGGICWSGSNTFVVGAPKTATSALARHLAGHPQIWLPEPKEPFFLSEPDFPGLAAQHGLASLADYEALYAGSLLPVRVDASTLYCRSPAAIKAAESLTANTAKYIFGVRKPSRLVHSFYKEQLVQLNERRTSFDEAWSSRNDLRSGDWSGRAPERPFLDYESIGQVGTQLASLVSTVGRERVFVYVQEEIVRDQRELLSALWSFLGLPDDGRYAIEPANTSGHHRWELLARLVLTPPKFLEPAMTALRRKAAGPDGSIAAKVKSFLRVDGPGQPLSRGLSEELDLVFASEMTLVEDILGRGIEEWR